MLQILWRCLPFLRPVSLHIAGLAGSIALLGLLAVPVGVLLLDLHWSRVLGGEPLLPLEARALALDAAEFVAVDALSEDARRHVLQRTLIWGFAAMVLLAPIGAALIYYGLWILQRVNQVLRIQLLERIQMLSMRYHSDSRVGDAIYRVHQDSAMVTNVIETLFLRPAYSILAFAIGLVVVFQFDRWLAAYLALVWPPALGLGAYFSTRLRARFRSAREANSALTSRVQETLAGIRVIKAYATEASELQRFERESVRAFSASRDARSMYAVFGVAGFWITAVLLILGSVRGALLAHGQSPLSGTSLLLLLGFSAWNLGLLNGYKWMSGSASSSVERMLQLWGRLQDVAIGLDRVFELLDREPEVKDAPDAIDLPFVSHGIAFRDVSFGYQPGRPVVRGVNLEARVGKITAIVGPTGSGKSTLMALLLRLFDPDSGSIEIDNVDLRQVGVASLRANIAVALQENILFGTSIRENIRYAVPEASDADVRKAARIACADSFIDALPAGYDTALGERGTKLSTGQRQRLSIARAVLKETTILILDEPTSSLDAETELAVLTNLAEWGRERAIFLITHRLSTIRSSDEILFLKEGAIVERGTHDDLMRRADGAYRRLVDSAGPKPTLEPAAEGR